MVDDHWIWRKAHVKICECDLLKVVVGKYNPHDECFDLDIKSNQIHMDIVNHFQSFHKRKHSKQRLVRNTNIVMVIYYLVVISGVHLFMQLCISLLNL